MGVLYPAGKSGGGLGGTLGSIGSESVGLGLVEFPAFPERTTFAGRLLGAIWVKIGCGYSPSELVARWYNQSCEVDVFVKVVSPPLSLCLFLSPRDDHIVQYPLRA
jgi:hypothetical protein